MHLTETVTQLTQTALDCAEALTEDECPDEARHARRAARFLRKAADALELAGL